ncbi:MAG: hypothetical protein GTO12_09700 [Proteobacteria bacterium]|nr:hypothetical protein [Pseudomonadota bacterium]
MEAPKSLDAIDQTILRILSAYEQLTPLELWFELGENDTVKERATEGEILSRLESLTARGFVERLTSAGVDGISAAAIYRVKTGK